MENTERESVRERVSARRDAPARLPHLLERDTDAQMVRGLHRHSRSCDEQDGTAEGLPEQRGPSDHRTPAPDRQRSCLSVALRSGPCPYRGPCHSGSPCASGPASRMCVSMICITTSTRTVLNGVPLLRCRRWPGFSVIDRLRCFAMRMLPTGKSRLQPNESAR